MKINKSTLTIGGDPEVFLLSNLTGNLVSAIDKIPGSKDDPYKLPELGEGFAIQTDCCSVEFNLPVVNFNPHDTNESALKFHSNVEKMFEYIRNVIPNGLDISLQTSGEFSESELNHPQAVLAGCSIDYNAWLLGPNEKPDFEATNVRCNGAHLHFGYENPNDMLSVELIKALDLTLGVTSVLFDSDNQRRKLYGKAGCFRLTSFGIEYRTPSPFYLASLDLIEYVFKAIDKAVDLVNQEKEYSDIEQLDIQTCINLSDIDMAKELIKKYELLSILPVQTEVSL